MRLRQRRSGKVASGKRAARGHWDIRKRKGRPARARGISGVPLPPGARAGRNPIGETDPVAARCALATGYHPAAPAGARKPQRQPAGFRKLSQWINFNIHWLHFQIELALPEKSAFSGRLKLAQRFIAGN